MTIKTNPNLLWSSLLSFSLLFGACNSNAPETATADNHTQAPNSPVVSYNELAVAPPIKGVDVPFQFYTLTTDEPKEINTPNGSRITIHANAFVDKNGQLVEGEVDIRYREFHNAAEIIASGIPMHNPDNGAYMQTAGMFEIKGEQNGKEIFIAANKPLHVEMGSKIEGDAFSFYQLGPKDCRWEDKGTQAAKPNQRKLTCLRQLDEELETAKPKFVKSTQTNNFVFDLEIDYRRRPELKAFKNVVWEYTGQGSNPEQNEWIFEAGTTWNSIDLNPLDNGYYQLVFTGSGKEFSTTVRPVLSDEDYDKALAEFNQRSLAEYEAIKAKQASIREGAEAQMDLMRSFNVNDFGIYNWDIWKNGNRLKCHLKPEFDILAEESFEQTGNRRVSFFLVSDDSRSVVRYDGSDLDKFSFNPEEENMLVAVLPNGRAALAKNEDFKTFGKRLNNKQWTLQLETTGEVITSVEDLRKLMQS